MDDQDFFGKLISLLGKISSYLNSEQFYHKRNHGEVNLNDYSSECKPLITAYMDTNKHRNLRRMCAQLVKYLKTAYKTMGNESNAYNDCILLNYWTYSTLVSIFNSDDPSTIARPFAILQQIWNGIVEDPSYKSHNNKCIPDNKIATQNDWRERKALYDYCVNYDALKLTLEFFKDKCKDYWTYVDSHTSIYEYFEKLCSEENDQCPNFYSKCEKYDPKYVLQRETFDCHAEMMDKKAKDALAKARQSLQADKSNVQERNSGLPTSSDISSGGLQSPLNGTHPSTKTGNILLGVVATSLASGALYRFTPLGSMLRNGLGWNNNNMRNMHGGEYGLFDYATESYNPYTGGGEEHYIGYQPA